MAGRMHGWLLAIAACASAPYASAAERAQSVAQSLELSAIELFDLAGRAKEAGDLESAKKAYRALAKDPDIEIRSEARFRLALMLMEQGQLNEAAVELRHILDEKPDVARVRVELARVLARMGNTSAARRELRRAQAGGLPPDVARLVQFYSDALRSGQPFGGSFEVALAPSSNINHATSSETLGTILGEFTLSEDARETSGLGLSLKQQIYWRPSIGERTNLLLRLSASGDVYGQDEFNDFSATFQAGPEMTAGDKHLSIAAVYGRRWFGGHERSRTSGMSVGFAHGVGPQSQVRLDAAALHSDDRLNDAQDGPSYSMGASFERAFTPELGAAVQIAAARLDAEDPGYATTSGTVGIIAFRDFGRTSIVASGSYSHLEADETLFLFPERRIDDRYTISLGATFRQMETLGFAPLVRIQYELNKSTSQLYDYGRLSSEFGIVRAF